MTLYPGIERRSLVIDKRIFTTPPQLFTVTSLILLCLVVQYFSIQKLRSNNVKEWKLKLRTIYPVIFLLFKGQINLFVSGIRRR